MAVESGVVVTGGFELEAGGPGGGVVVAGPDGGRYGAGAHPPSTANSTAAQSTTRRAENTDVTLSRLVWIPSRPRETRRYEQMCEETLVQPGQPDLQMIMQQAQKMQEQLMAAQAELAEAEVIGQAGNGLVQVTTTAAGEVRSVRIDPKVVDPDDVETLQDLVVGALHDAARAAGELQAEKMGPLAGALGGGAEGLGLPGLG